MPDQDTPEQVRALSNRVEYLGESLEDHEGRLRKVERAVVSLEEMPETLRQIRSSLEDLVRLDQRVETLETGSSSDRDALDVLDDRIDVIDRRIAKYAGGIAVLIFLFQMAGPYLQNLLPQ